MAVALIIGALFLTNWFAQMPVKNDCARYPNDHTQVCK